MEITYLGHSSFKIKGKEATVVTDPFDHIKATDVGLKFPKVEADIVTVSHNHNDHNGVSLVQGNPFIADRPGEYEIKGISIFGYPSSHETTAGVNFKVENIIYLIEADGLRICHLGDLGKKVDEAKLEEIDGVDILLIPVGGFYTIGPKEASELITAIEPSIVIPMHFKIKEMGPSFDKILPVKDFLAEMGASQAIPAPKLIISKDKLPEERQIILLETKNS